MNDYYCPKCKNRMVHSGHSTEKFQDKIETRTEYVCPIVEGLYLLTRIRQMQPQINL